MKSYTKVYFGYFKIDPGDFVPCEICGSIGKDIHHIQARSKRRDLLNDIVNIMCLCRECHEKHGDRKDKIEWLQEIHNKHLHKLPPETESEPF